MLTSVLVVQTHATMVVHASMNQEILLADVQMGGEVAHVLKVSIILFPVSNDIQGQ